MRRLSAVAEIDSGSLYEYIGSKETLLWDLVGGVFDEAAEYVTRRSMVHAQWSASKAIRAFFDWGNGRREALAIAVRDGHCLGDTHRYALDASRARLISRLATALEAELVDANKTVSSVVGAEMLMGLAMPPHETRVRPSRRTRVGASHSTHSASAHQPKCQSATERRGLRLRDARRRPDRPPRRGGCAGSRLRRSRSATTPSSGRARSSRATCRRRGRGRRARDGNCARSGRTTPSRRRPDAQGPQRPVGRLTRLRRPRPRWPRSTAGLVAGRRAGVVFRRLLVTARPS